jgi:hypothetical protein
MRETERKRHGEQANAADAPDIAELTRTMLDSQRRMLRLAAEATAAFRDSMARQNQRQAEYLAALLRCRDMASLGYVNADFAQRMSQEVARDWQDMSQLLSHWLGTSADAKQTRERS